MDQRKESCSWFAHQQHRDSSSTGLNPVVLDPVDKATPVLGDGSVLCGYQQVQMVGISLMKKTQSLAEKTKIPLSQGEWLVGIVAGQP